MAGGRKVWRCGCFVACCCFVASLCVVVWMLALRLLARSCCYCMTAGWGATEVYWMLRPTAPCDVKHFKLAVRGLLSFISLLGAFLLNAIKRNQVRWLAGGRPKTLAWYATQISRYAPPD